MDEVVRVFQKADGTREVEIVQHADGTYGFAEWRFEQAESAWCLCGRYSAAHVDSLDDVIREARGRVSWLADAD